MKKELINFKGLYGDNSTAFLPNFIHHELLEIRSKIYDWEIKEHLHTDLFQLFIITEGQGMVFSESNQYPIASPSLITIPANTLHGFAFQPDTVGEVITFSESYFDNIFKSSPKISFEISKFNLFNFENQTADFELVQFYKNQIIKELLEEVPENQSAIQLLFQLLFIQIYRLSITQNIQSSMTDNRSLKYFQAFQKSIKNTITETRPIHEYAKELNITTVHLNRICQAIVQKSALQIVQNHLINEAKKYLLNTSYTISEVSYLLNFKDPAYFTRLFKKHTGVAPKEFRRN